MIGAFLKSYKSLGKEWRLRWLVIHVFIWNNSKRIFILYPATCNGRPWSLLSLPAGVFPSRQRAVSVTGRKNHMPAPVSVTQHHPASPTLFSPNYSVNNNTGKISQDTNYGAHMCKGYRMINGKCRTRCVISCNLSGC